MKNICFLIVFVIAFPTCILGQQLKTQAPAERRGLEARQERELKRAKAVSLVEQTASEALLWDDRQTAVLVLSDAADLLWAQNPKTRVWLEKAWDLIDKIDERENSEEMRQIWRGSLRSSLRTRVLNVALKHDSQLSDRFLKLLAKSESSGQSERGAFDDRTARSEQLLRLAMEAVDVNPEMAVSLAERSLQDGISFNFQTVLLRLLQTDVNSANRLFDSALARLANSVATLSEVRILAAYLFNPGQVLAHLPDGTMTVGVVQTQLPQQSPAQADPRRARLFLTIAQRILISLPFPTNEGDEAPGDFLLCVNLLAQPFQIYAMDLWPSIAVRAANLRGRVPVNRERAIAAEAKSDGATRGSAEESSRVDALEREAEREWDPIRRKLKFAEAALATVPKDLERGKRLAARIEGDQELSERINAFLYFRTAMIFLVEKNVEKAEETALKIPTSIEAAVALIAVAQKLAAFKPISQEDKREAVMRRQRAIELLFEAEKSLKREDALTKIAKVRLGKTAISHLVDTSQAFSDLGQAIAAINRLEKFDPTDSSAPHLGVEGFKTAKFTVPRLDFGFGFRNALEPLIQEDLELTLSTIDSLTSPSVRGACRLEVAKQILHSPLLSLSVQTKPVTIRPIK